MNTTTNVHLSKTAIGAVAGFLVAILWIVFGTGATIVLVALTLAGALLGYVLDSPDRLISVLERLRTDR